VAENPELVVSGNAAQALFRIEKKMAEGTIKKKTEKGFGFIDIGGGEDMFFHMSNVEGVTFDQLYEGQQVTFNEGQGPKGPRAENVRPV
jgi:CspA family cold shock protein